MTLEKYLAKLISFHTVSGNHQEVERALAWVRERIQDLPLYVREYLHGGFHSLVVTTQHTKKPKVWLAAHIDVAPGLDTQFRLKKQGSKLYGRGASSMKYALACYLKLLEEWGPRVRDFDVGLMITSDEEIGGHQGTKALLNKRGYSGDCVLLPDEATSWQMEEWAKGMYGFKLVAEGKAIHGSRPWKGKNAVMMLCRFINDLQVAFEKEFVQGGESHWHSTLSVGMIFGGVAMNQVPKRAEAHLDMRYISLDERKRFGRLLQKLLKQHPGVTTQKIIDERDYGITRDDEYAQAFIACAKKAKIAVAWERADSSSDARYFAAKGIPALRIGPKGGGVLGDGEWIDAKDLERFYKVMKVWVEETARVKGK